MDFMDKKVFDKQVRLDWINQLFFLEINILILKLQLQTKQQQKPIMSYYHRDCLSIKSNKILANLFAELILLSEKVQSFRQLLASVPYYDCVELFRVLDKDEKGFLTLRDFIRLIGQSHKKVVTYAFSWFDQAKLGEVSRLEFIAFLMPRRNEDLRQMIARRIQEPSSDQNFSLTINEQLRIFTDLINQMISHELKIIEQRKLLLKQEDYSVKGVLNSLDVNAHQFVSTNDILKFLRNYAIEATKQQLKDFLEIVDSKLEGKITLEQVNWIIEGLQDSKGDYREKLSKSSKKRQFSARKESKPKPSQKLQEEEGVNVKQFVRTPLRSKEQNYDQRSFEDQFSKISKFSSSQNKLKQSQQSLAKRQVKDPSFQKREQLLAKSGYKYENNEFEEILKKYRQVEAEAIKKDAELIMAEQQMKQKLREQFYERSNSHRKAITESNSLTSQSGRKPAVQNESRDYGKQDYLRQSLNKEPTKEQSSPQNSYYNYPYTSQYDRKINTIVDNFYRRNNETAPLHYSQKRHGTVSSSFYDRVGEISYQTASYDRHGSTRKRLLDEELQREKQRAKVKPFDYRPNFVKEEINKKLGDDIYNIKLASRAYDSLAHQARQKPLEQSIKRLKASTDRIDERQRLVSANGMMENISIISKNSNTKVEESGKKPSEVGQLNVFKTQIKQKPVSTPSSGYQTVQNGDWTKSRGQRTTETKYPYAQTENKMTPSLLKIKQESIRYQ